MAEVEPFVYSKSIIATDSDVTIAPTERSETNSVTIASDSVANLLLELCCCMLATLEDSLIALLSALP